MRDDKLGESALIGAALVLAIIIMLVGAARDSIIRDQTICKAYSLETTWNGYCRVTTLDDTTVTAEADAVERCVAVAKLNDEAGFLWDETLGCVMRVNVGSPDEPFYHFVPVR